MKEKKYQPPRNEYKLEFNQALSTWHNGDTVKAIEDLRALAERYENESPILGMIGGIYFDAERYEDALPYLQKAVALSPKSELFSVCLFHTYYSLAREKEAWSEMDRFKALSSSAEYDRLIEDLRADFGEQ